MASPYWKRKARKIAGELADRYQDVGGYERIGLKTWPKFQVELLDALSHGEKEIERLIKIIEMDRRFGTSAPGADKRRK